MRYKNLAEQCIADIQVGKMPQHTKMPSLRTFTQQHNISMTTAINCYRHLETLGWVIARPQSGYFVTNKYEQYDKPEFIQFTSCTTDPKHTQIKNSYTPLVNTVGPLGFSRISPDYLPIDALQHSFRRALKRQGERISAYPDPQGETLLRESLCNHFTRYDFHVSSQDMVITNGCMDAIKTALEITTDVGDAVAISSPCFSGLLDILTSMSRRVVEIPSTEEGIDLMQLERHMQYGKVKAGLFCTSHMNPQGTSMTALQKQQLVKLAEQYQIPIIEDDVYFELSHGKVTPLPAKFWDKKGYVLWCGSVSKTLAAGYRLGWCLPGRFLSEYLKKRRFSNHGVASPIQLAVADFVSNGDYYVHLKKVRDTLRRHTLDYHAFLRQRLPENSRISFPSGGIVLWIQVPILDTNKLYEQSNIAKIDLRVGASFSTLGLYADCLRINIGFALSTEAKEEKTEVENQLIVLLDLITATLDEQHYLK
jgi:DNA-binding transcriptional MocR family regulator